MLSLALRTLRARKGGFVGAFVALLFASTLVTACGIMLESGLRGGTPTERYAGTAVIVAGQQSYRPVVTRAPDDHTPDPMPVGLPERVGVDAGLAAKIRQLPGVARTIADVSFPATAVRDGQPLLGPGGTPSLGHGWDSAALTPFRLREGHEPSGDAEVVLDADLAGRAGVQVGGQVSVLVGGEPKSFQVAGIAEPVGVGLAKQSAMFFTGDQAGKLAGQPGRAAAIGVLAANGADVDELRDRVAAVVKDSGAVALAGADRGAAEFLAAGEAEMMLITLSTSFGGIALMVAILVVASTFGLSIQQRSREVALLRAIGTTPRQVRKMIAGEALAIGAVASVLGCLPGVALAHWMFGQFAQRGIVPDTMPMHVGPLPFAAALVAGVLTAVGATFAAGARAARTKPTEALGEAALERPGIGRGRLITGLVFLFSSLTMMLLPLVIKGDAAAAAVSGVVVFAITAVALLGPLISRRAATVLGGVIARSAGVSGYLARANALNNSRRLASAITPLVLAIGFAGTAIFAQTTMLAAGEADAVAGSRADAVLVSSTGGLPEEAARDAHRVPGVAATTSVARTKVVAEYTMMGEVQVRAVEAQAVDPAELAETVDLKVLTGDLKRLHGNEIAMSDQLAGSMGVKLGDTVKIRLGDGTPVEVKAIATYGRNLGFGDVVMDRVLVAGHTTTGLATEVLVRNAPGANTAAGLAALAQRYPGLTVVDQATVHAQHADQQRIAVWVNLILAGLIVAYTGIAVVNTLVMATSARVREFALLRLIGATRRQVLRMSRWEGLLVVVTSVVLGTAVAAATLVPFSYAMSGSPWPTVPPATYLAIIGFTALLGMIGTILPTRLALRSRPADAIGMRE
ncbi:FtsX-like permease family protein [Solihabitans fulvus]|uniref:FtsX-like permease family protein n=1 Tax=Solihabitans fulvus TaxID=1892852 RepID=A0A5B2XER8_9PSEU|nr:FtsX-like permease family protein [Solihabitans fulvus]KAA2262298.1 FtsX-like permease family protein [Solihabitans fulvus]